MGNSMVYYPTYQSMMRRVRFSRGRNQPILPSRYDLMTEVIAAIRAHTCINGRDVVSEINNRTAILGARGVKNDYR